MKYIVFWLLIVTSTVIQPPQKDEFGKTNIWSYAYYETEVTYEPHYKEFTDRQEALDFFNRAKKRNDISAVAIDSIETKHLSFGGLYFDTAGWYTQDSIIIDGSFYYPTQIDTLIYAP